MANRQSYMQGFGGQGVQVTTLSQIQGAGLRLPDGYIDIRAPGKLESLFLFNGNANRLYSANRPDDYGFKNALKTRLDYKNPNQGQSEKTTTKIGYAIDDAALIRDFLGTNQGFKFIGKQIILQGYQTFDETKIYNPASPLVAAIRLASLGSLDRPTRHIDTSNVIGGVVNALGLGSIISTIGAFTGGSPSQPAPPRSSVASEASRSGAGLSILTSFIGGGDRSNEVVAPIARGDVKGLLRGQTATNAYNNPRYSRLVSAGERKGFLKTLLGGVGKFIQNNTIVGGILPPKQPWNAKFRADENTYNLYLNARGLFERDKTTDVKVSVFKPLQSIISALGFGRRTNSISGNVTQRFYINSSDVSGVNYSVVTEKPGGRNRFIPISRKRNSRFNPLQGEYTNEILYRNSNNVIYITSIDNVSANPYITSKLKYSDTVKVDSQGTEYSDQLYNYQKLYSSEKRNDGTKQINNFEDAFSDPNSAQVENIQLNLQKLLNNIGDNNRKYRVYKNITPAQFSLQPGSKLGMEYLTNLEFDKPKDPIAQSNLTNYEYKVNSTNYIPSRLGKNKKNHRFIRPTNDVDYVNALSVLNETEFANKYSQTEEYGKYGPDIIKFYFYDIINKKYIPFNATVKNLTDNNQADYETIEYLGRPDKLYYYKGFSRTITFNFSVVAHSVKELMPMWKRINYLVGLTRPSNYTQRTRGFMVPPMVQLTLGDFYKNHNVIIDSCNVTIPDDALWETAPEDSPDYWSYGVKQSIMWGLLDNGGRENSSRGRIAQFPRHAEINTTLRVLEKDKPVVGRAIWGEAPFGVEKINSGIEISTGVTQNDESEIDQVENIYTLVPNKDLSNLSNNTFSQNIRTDVEVLEDPNPPKVLNKPKPVSAPLLNTVAPISPQVPQQQNAATFIFNNFPNLEVQR